MDTNISEEMKDNIFKKVISNKDLWKILENILNEIANEEIDIDDEGDDMLAVLENNNGHKIVININIV